MAVVRGSVGTSYVNSRCPARQIVVVERSVLTEINEDAVLLFHGTSTVEVTVLPWYRNTTNTAVLPYGTCQQSHFSENFRAKNQFIDLVNKLEVFKL